uniref:Ig-like domain-containing protein n=1 Tax=Laticauda laticaudata TaxID=8630 RepID=A0A8C5S157_LATLA
MEGFILLNLHFYHLCLGFLYLSEENCAFTRDHYCYFAELPIVKVTHQEVVNNLQALTCQAYGFYPKEISASWRKDGEIFNQTNSSVHIAPNSDGTFHARLSIQINPKERNLYRCHVEHVSSNEKVIKWG